MIKKFQCENFRNVSCSDLDFARINLLIGANNGGKSNFIRALSFAANMVSAYSDEPTGFLSELKRNGWDGAVDRRQSDPRFRLTWNLELDKDLPVVYTLQAHTGPKREDNYITEETLDSGERIPGFSEPYHFFQCHSFRSGRGQFSTAGMNHTPNNLLMADVSPLESVLLQMDNLFFTNKEMFSTPFVRDNIRQVLDFMRRYFRGFYSYSCAAFHVAAIREMQDEQADGSALKKDGSNFVNVLADIMESDPAFLDRYRDKLGRLIGGFQDIQLPRAGGKLWMELKMNGCSFPLAEQSDGTVHLLLLLLLLNLPRKRGMSMLAVDEPEMNLHPAWQKLMAHEILRGESFKQCFISTHSPDFLDEFTQDFLEGHVNVIVFDPSSKRPLRQLDRNELRNELQNWTLGDLYRIGDPLIGGWPQ